MTGWHALGDWGSTRLRLWRVQDGVVRDMRHGLGIVGLTKRPADVLKAALASWCDDGPPSSITLCGMVGARGGLREVPYLDCPLDAATWTRLSTVEDVDSIGVRIAPGCATRIGGDRPVEVMRGEETQVFGALALRPDLASGERLLILPGTHSKWVSLVDGQISGFRTFITGELFSLLRTSSLLAGQDEDDGDEADTQRQAGFLVALERSKTEAGPLGALFTARAARLREGKSLAWSRGFLSGLLISAEISEMRRAMPVVPALTLIGDGALVSLYTKALCTVGLASHELDGETCSLAGLRMFDAYH